MNIPKILCQTSVTPLPHYVNAMWKLRMQADWKHSVFDNNKQRQFLVDNYIEEFPNLLTLYDSLVLGQHKSDIFRFAYLYLNGGVYIDSDTMTNVFLDDFINDFDAVIVYNNNFLENNILNLPVFGPFVAIGVMAFTPKHDFVYKLLHALNNSTSNDFDNCYMYVGKLLYDIVKLNECRANIKILEEFHHDDVAITKDKFGKLIYIHYWKHSNIIPQDFSIAYRPDTTIVTAFYDINRSTWKYFNRSNDAYISSFKRLIELQNQIIVYTAPTTFDLVKNIAKHRENVKVISYDLINEHRELLNKISVIQKSNEYSSMVRSDLKNNPEYTHPEYVLVTTSKLLFLKMALPIIDTKNIAWLDFGYCRDTIDMNTVVSYDSPYIDNKFHMNGLKFINDDKWSDYIFNNDVYVDGSSLVGPASRLEEFYNAYYKMIEKYLNQNIVDDDQSYFAMIAYYYKSLLEVHVTGKWFNFF